MTKYLSMTHFSQPEYLLYGYTEGWEFLADWSRPQVFASQRLALRQANLTVARLASGFPGIAQQARDAPDRILDHSLHAAQTRFLSNPP